MNVNTHGMPWVYLMCKRKSDIDIRLRHARIKKFTFTKLLVADWSVLLAQVLFFKRYGAFLCAAFDTARASVSAGAAKGAVNARLNSLPACLLFIIVLHGLLMVCTHPKKDPPSHALPALSQRALPLKTEASLKTGHREMTGCTCPVWSAFPESSYEGASAFRYYIQTTIILYHARTNFDVNPHIHVRYRRHEHPDCTS